jgi:ubiquinone/menaquinone biosynthesis C-methylase UbiE
MARDHYASPFGAAFSAYMERPRLSRAIGRLFWGIDMRPFYESMTAIDEVAGGGTIVDCPCGAGPALRALGSNADVRYVGVDLSPSMLRRARRRARARGLANVEFAEANATDIPVPDGAAELFLSYNGLHCFDDPAAALAEAARVLKPGGRLVGCCFVRGTGGLRARLLLRPHSGDFGPIGTEPEVREWLRAAGFRLSSAQLSGPMLYFEATRPGPTTPRHPVR